MMDTRISTVRTAVKRIAVAAIAIALLAGAVPVCLPGGYAHAGVNPMLITIESNLPGGSVRQNAYEATVGTGQQHLQLFLIETNYDSVDYNGFTAVSSDPTVIKPLDAGAAKAGYVEGSDTYRGKSEYHIGVSYKHLLVGGVFFETLKEGTAEISLRYKDGTTSWPVEITVEKGKSRLFLMTKQASQYTTVFQIVSTLNNWAATGSAGQKIPMRAYTEPAGLEWRDWSRGASYYYHMFDCVTPVPAKDVKWSLSGKKLKKAARISKKGVIAIKKKSRYFSGKKRVRGTVYARYGGDKAAMRVTANRKRTRNAKKLIIYKRSRQELLIGERRVMKSSVETTVSQDARVRYKSSKKKVLTVDSWGVGTAHKTGKAVLTVRTGKLKAKRTLKVVRLSTVLGKYFKVRVQRTSYDDYVSIRNTLI